MHGNNVCIIHQQIFDGISRLGAVYSKLCAAGCILFKHWTATFYCDPQRGVHSEINFGLKGDHNILKGYQKDTREVSVEIKLVCEFMEACLNDWNHSIGVERSQFYHLNHFTTEQLVILCSELAKFCIPQEKKNFSPRIYHMLDAVKKDCTKKVR